MILRWTRKLSYALSRKSSIGQLFADVFSVCIWSSFCFLSLDAGYASLDSIVCSFTPGTFIKRPGLPPILGWIGMYLLYPYRMFMSILLDFDGQVLKYSPIC